MKLISNMATYSLMVRDARGAILNPGAQISKAGAEFMPPAGTRGAILKSGAQYWGPQGLELVKVEVK